MNSGMDAPSQTVTMHHGQRSACTIRCGVFKELTPEILNETVERIEISHVTKKSKPGNVIHIYWKLK